MVQTKAACERTVASFRDLLPSSTSLTPQLLHKVNHADDEDTTEGERDDSGKAQRPIPVINVADLYIGAKHEDSNVQKTQQQTCQDKCAAGCASLLGSANQSAISRSYSMLP